MEALLFDVLMIVFFIALIYIIGGYQTHLEPRDRLSDAVRTLDKNQHQEQ